MRTLVGVGTPRGLQGRLAAIVTLIVTLWMHATDLWCADDRRGTDQRSVFTGHHRFDWLFVGPSE